MSIFTTLQNKLHSTLQTDFWLQLMEGIAEELELQKAKKKSKVTLNDLDSMNEDDLYNLANKYGYTPNLVLDDSFTMLKSEVKSIPYRIKNKTTFLGSLFSFSQAKNRKGAIYNTVYEENNLARILDVSTTITNASNYDSGDVFIGIAPETLFFKSYLDVVERILPTKHYTTEYFFDRLIEENSLNYTITPTYITFMLSENLYNKRASSIPHTGIQINSVISASKMFNALNLDPEYTIPTLELQSATTKEGEVTPDARLDEGLFLDEFWRLDQSSAPIYTISIDDFYYFSVGIGRKGLDSIDFPDIYDNVQLHLPFSDPCCTGEVVDVTNNYTSITITGNDARIAGILGTSLNYDKDTYLVVPSFTLSPSDWTFNFWFKVPLEDLGGERYLISFQPLDIYIKEATNSIEIVMRDGTNTYTDSIVEDYRGQEIFCQLEYDITNELLNIYFNTVLVSSLDTTGNLGFDIITDLYIGTSYSTPTIEDNKFIGLIDEFSYHGNKIFSSAEKNFIYNTRYGSHRYLGNTVYRTKLSPSEKYSIVNGDEYFLIQAKAKANTVNNESVHISDGLQKSFTSIPKYSPLVKGGMRLEYKNVANDDIVISDDKLGNLISDSLASGSINYNTGEITLNFYKDFIIDNVIYSESSESVVNLNLNSIIQTESFEIVYTYLGISYTGLDNGLGAITGTNISSGTINYTTGTVAISFTGITDINKPVRYSYIYREEDIPLVTQNIIAEYQTQHDLELTECGFENVDGEVIQYTSFPPCKFGTPNAFLSNNTIIKVSE